MAGIREVDKNHIVILGGARWDTNFSVFSPPFDSNVMYTFHKYWMKPEQAEIQEYVDFRDKYHVPIWMSESGENTDEWITQFRELLEKNQIPWAFWPYKKMDSPRSVVSFTRPQYWDEIVAYAKLQGGTGDAEKHHRKASVAGAYQRGVRGVAGERSVQQVQGQRRICEGAWADVRAQ